MLNELNGKKVLLTGATGLNRFVNSKGTGEL